jgi:hypothetical protein
MIVLIAFGTLAAAATVGTLVTVAKDGYRRVPTRYAR